MAATSVLKLVVDDKEYSASLKNAKQGMLDLQQSLEKSGKTFADVDGKVVEYARALGQMNAEAKTTKGKIGEMSSAFVELSIQYKHLSDAEKQSPVGKAMAQSLDQLRGRVQEAKQDLEQFENELRNINSVSSEGGGGDGIRGMLEVFGGNMLTKAAGMVANLGNEVLDCMTQSAALASEAEGIQIAFARLGRGDLLDGLKEATHGTVSELELMKAAVKFNDFKLPLDQLGTMLAFAQQKAKDTGQSVDYMVDSIVTGLGRKSLMILDNLGLSAAQIKEKMKETGDMTVAVGEIIREEMSKSGDYVETAADRAAQANAELQDAMLELGTAMKDVFGVQFSGWSQVATIIKREVVGTITFTIETIGRAKEALQGFINWTKSLTGSVSGAVAGEIRNQQGKGGAGYSDIAAAQRWINNGKDDTERQRRYEVMIADLQDKLNKATTDRARQAIETRMGMLYATSYEVTETPTTDKTNTKKTGNSKGKSIKEEKDDFVEIVGLIPMAEEEVKSLQNQISESWDEGEITELNKKLVKAQEELNRLRNLGKDTKNDMATGFSGVTENSLKAWTSAQQSSLGNMTIGSEAYSKTQANIINVQSFTTAMNEAIKKGVTLSDDTKEQMWSQLIDPEGEGIREKLQEFIDAINSQLAEGIEPIKIDLNTGQLKKEIKDTNDSWKDAASAIQQVGGALNQIEDPMAKVMGTVAQAVATMALSYAEATVKATDMGPWAWIAFAATGLATMVTAISTIHSATGYAEGGMIPGNSYSGDSQWARVNAGEVILNKAQQANLASQLHDGGNAGTSSVPYVNGEQIFLGINNYLRRSGRGEIITSR